MMINRMRRLAGIQEAMQIEDPDDEDRQDDERQAREAKIRNLISLAFKRINLAIAEDGIFYIEEDGREALITLDDSEVDIDRLAALKQTGLAASYVVWGTKDGLTIMCSIDPGLDHAEIAPRMSPRG